MSRWVSLPLSHYEDGGRPSRDAEAAVMRLADGDVRRVRTSFGEELDAVWDDRRYFLPCDNEGMATSEDGLDVVAVMVPEKLASGGPTQTEARRSELGKSRLHVRIATASLNRLDELCADSGFTRPEQIEALIDCEHDWGPTEGRPTNKTTRAKKIDTNKA